MVRYNLNMKILRFTLCLMVAMIFGACSAKNHDYDPEKCKPIFEKVQKNETLSDGEMGELLDQLLAMAKIIDAKTKEYMNDPKKLADYQKEHEILQMKEFASAFDTYLYYHLSELSPQNKKKYEDAVAEMNSLQNQQ